MKPRRRMEAAADLDFPLPSVEELAGISVSSFAYQLPAHQLSCYHQYVCSMLLACAGMRRADLEKGGQEIRNLDKNTEASSPATFGSSIISAESSSDAASRSYRAAAREEQRLGAWSVRCELSSRGGVDEEGGGGVLCGKRVVMKDNMAVRGLPMYCGTPFFFAPLVDSPLVTRCLEAGAIIVGKAQCEYMCLSASSHTASAGLVRNPVAVDYQAGGSSSGCAALVAAGEADLSIGCDQGGSCRIPAAMCGVVGCKPTHGLVPYTFIDGMYNPIDHAGPISRTVEENALLLGVLAGWDGVDERPSPATRCREKVDYSKTLKEGVKGMRIGVVTEALMMPFVEEDVKQAVQSSAQVLREMGAQVEAVSVPLHFTAPGVWVMYTLPRLVERLFYSQEKDILLGVDEHGKVYDRLTFLQEKLLAHVASWSVTFRIAILAGEWLRVHFPDSLQVAELHKQQLIEGYCSALLQFDALLLPTMACKAKKLTTHLSTAHDYENASAELLAEHAQMATGLTLFTSCFNLTGHPAVSVPVAGGLGKSGAEGDGAPMLPIGAMLVANYFQEALLYRVAYALEQGHHQQSSLFQQE